MQNINEFLLLLQSRRVIKHVYACVYDFDFLSLVLTNNPCYVNCSWLCRPTLHHFASTSSGTI